jgi:VIT1/CCC1 family predicted Fe2+/Mn2+ transporter
MTTPNDHVTLSIEERRALAALDDRAGRDNPTLNASLTSGWRRARLHSRRVRNLAAALGFVAAAALMLATFVPLPAVAAAGLVVQVVCLQALLRRWGPPAGARVTRWIESRSAR